MSYYYARIPTSASRTVPTARGYKSAGIAAEVLTADGGVRVSVRHAGGGDIVTVERIAHPQSGNGKSEVIAVFPMTCATAAEFAATQCDCPHCGRDLDPGESLCGDSDCPRHDNA